MLVYFFHILFISGHECDTIKIILALHDFAEGVRRLTGLKLNIDLGAWVAFHLLH